MAENPLRQRRMDFVRSDEIETSEGIAYHVKLKPKDGEPPITVLEMSTQRDFNMGISLGSLAIVTLIGLSVSVSLLGSIGIICAGAAIGGISDYTRNKKEIEEGVYISKPTIFSRDTFKSALSWGFIGKITVMASAGLIAALGIDVPGGELLEQAWQGAESSGFLGQMGAVMRAVPPVVDMASFAIPATYGAVKGAHVGLHRMQAEYDKAYVKHKHPVVEVELAMEPSMSFLEAGINIAAPALSGGIASELINAAAASKTELDGRKEHLASELEHGTSLERSFVKAEEMRREKAALNEVVQGV